MFCVVGCTSPQTCDPGRVIDFVGAGFKDQCDVCPAGKICPDNAIVARDCTPGKNLNFIIHLFIHSFIYPYLLFQIS